MCQHFTQRRAPSNLQALIVATVVSRHRRREQSKGMMDVRSWQGLVAIPPKLQIPACEFPGHHGVELEGRTQTSSNLFEVFHLEYGGGGAVEFKNLDCGLKDVLP